MDKPSSGLCRDWRSHPVTKYVLAEIDKAIQAVSEEALKHAGNSETEFEALKKILKSSGSVAAYDTVYDLIDEVASQEDEDDTA